MTQGGRVTTPPGRVTPRGHMTTPRGHTTPQGHTTTQGGHTTSEVIRRLPRSRDPRGHMTASNQSHDPRGHRTRDPAIRPVNLICKGNRRSQVLPALPSAPPALANKHSLPI